MRTHTLGPDCFGADRGGILAFSAITTLFDMPSRVRRLVSESVTDSTATLEVGPLGEGVSTCRHDFGERVILWTLDTLAKITDLQSRGAMLSLPPALEGVCLGCQANSPPSDRLEHEAHLS